MSGHFPARHDSRYLAHCLGLRVDTYRTRDGLTLYALWPADGFRWELADPPVATSWEGMRRILRIIWEGAGWVVPVPAVIP